ncbi:MAG: ZIP family metal transporter [Clostridia bacterium]|nr:ZIP family metal transporter [Clostridia bacterium]
MKPVIMALLATLGTWAVTAIGAAVVFFLKKPNRILLDRMLGFAAGVMIAASFWSLLQPAIELAQTVSLIPAYLVAAFGFLCGAFFMRISDKAVCLLRGSRENRTVMLVLSVTLHNIPEGLAVGVAFGALQGGYTREMLLGAIAVAVGIGLQNFPEGMAVSAPLRREGHSRLYSFLVGQASGMVEPVAGILGAVLVVRMQTMLPYALSFAAGAMILVAVHELIPECQKSQGEKPYAATTGVILGFAVMMLLDVMLG